MADFVLDANVAVATVILSDANDYSDRPLERVARGESAFVPAVWHLETMNAVRERRRSITKDVRDEALATIISPESAASGALLMEGLALKRA